MSSPEGIDIIGKIALFRCYLSAEAKFKCWKWNAQDNLHSNGFKLLVESGKVFLNERVFSLSGSKICPVRKPFQITCN